MKNINFNKIIQEGYSYKEYYLLSEKLAKAGKSTSIDDTEEFAKYAKLNVARMRRVYKTTAVNLVVKEKLNSLKNNQTWIVLSESWCGDAAQNLPIIAKIAEESNNINLKIVLRDNTLELMDQFLTNGGRSIPKLVAVDNDGDVLFTWGPRPLEVQNMVLDNKTSKVKTYEELSLDIQKWYLNDKGQTLQNELLLLATS